jgi:hypothetical protein
LLITGEPPQRVKDRKPNPNACTGLAENKAQAYSDFT